MKPVRNRAGVILNTAALRASQVIGEQVECPACCQKTFDRWPNGWDAHAAHQCAALEAEDKQERKAEFKGAFRKLFRG